MEKQQGTVAVNVQNSSASVNMLTAVDMLKRNERREKVETEGREKMKGI